LHNPSVALVRPVASDPAVPRLNAGSQPTRLRLLRRAAPLIAYFVLILISFYPQSLHPSDTVALTWGDTVESIYIVAWNAHQLFRSPLHLFDANMLYPHEHSLTFTDHQILSSLAVTPVIWLTGNPVLAYSVAVALASFLAAFAARRLGLSLGLGALGAWAAGALYAFHTYQVHETPRLQILFHGFIPLALWQLLRLLTTGERRAAWGTALFMWVQGLCSNYELLYGCILLGLVCLGFLLARPRTTWPRLAPLALAGATAALVYLPVGLPYLLSSKTHGYARDLPQGTDLSHYVSTTPTNLIYGPIGVSVGLQSRAPHFVGFVSLVLAALALAAWAGRLGTSAGGVLSEKVWVPAAAVLALLFVALSLGRDMVAFGRYLGPGPYRLLYAIPGFHLMRYPERLGLLAMLFVGLLAGQALTLISRRGFGLCVLVLSGLVPLEHVSPRPVTSRIPVEPEIPSVYHWLAQNPVHALAEVPTHGEGLVRMESEEMYFSTYHFKPIIHGFVSYPTLLNRLLRRLASQFPSEVTLQAFQRIGVDTVVVHRGRQEALDLYHQLGGEGDLFRKLMKVAQLDVYERLPGALEAGRLRQETVFKGPEAHLYDGSVTADEVYRVVPADPTPAAPFPKGRRLRDPSWVYRTSWGDPSPAADGDLSTAWVSPDPLTGSEFFQVTFDRPVTVCGLVLPLRWDTVFPTRFRVQGLKPDGGWSRLASFNEGQALQLLDQLLSDPRTAAIGFEFPETSVRGLRLIVAEGGTSFDGWSIPEFEVRIP